MKNICQICHLSMTSQKGLLYHVKKQHNLTPKLYYDTLYPNSGKCEICHQPTKFLNFSNGYRQYCSHKCSAQSEITKQKRIQTTQTKYGVDNISQIPTIKQQKLIKYKENLPKIQEKIKQTNQHNYGVDWITQSEEFKQKAKETCLHKYGVDNYAKTDKWLNQLHIKLNENLHLYKEKGYMPIQEIIMKYGNGWRLNKIVPLIYYKNTAYVHESDLSTIIEYYKKNQYKNRSKLEDIVVHYIKSIYNDSISLNTRQIIKPYELDIFLPDINLGIEINGLYRHSTIGGCPKDYHLQKSILCQNMNIRLLHIYENDIINNWQLIKEQLDAVIMDNFNIKHSKIKLVYQNERYTIYGTNQLLYKWS